MIINKDCIEAMRAMEPDSVDAIVTDPPYGIGFMGKAWDIFKPEQVEKMKVAAQKREPRKDGRNAKGFGAAADAGTYDLSLSANQGYQEWCHLWAIECLRVLKPGGHMLVSCGARTYHRVASAIEDAGFEIRDQIMWVYGSGFPKSYNIGKAIGADTKAKKWEGWGTALKPAHEPIVLARKHISEKTVAANALRWGTGGLNIDGSRVRAPTGDVPSAGHRTATFGNVGGETVSGGDGSGGWEANGIGRFPANLIHDGSEEVLGTFPGHTASFFYTAKASKKERDAGLGDLPEHDIVTFATANGASGKPSSISAGRDTKYRNNHPTVKPIALMRYLIGLVTVEGSTVLDPFAGSGSTGVAAKQMGRRFVGIELDVNYCDIARKRIRAARRVNRNS